MPRAGSPEQRDINYVKPAENAVDDRPENRVVVGVGDRDRQRRAEADAVFGALDADAVVSISVHGGPRKLSASVLRANRGCKRRIPRSLSSASRMERSEIRATGMRRRVARMERKRNPGCATEPERSASRAAAAAMPLVCPGLRCAPSGLRDSE